MKENIIIMCTKTVAIALAIIPATVLVFMPSLRLIYFVYRIFRENSSLYLSENSLLYEAFYIHELPIVFIDILSLTGYRGLWLILIGGNNERGKIFIIYLLLCGMFSLMLMLIWYPDFVWIFTFGGPFTRIFFLFPFLVSILFIFLLSIEVSIFEWPSPI